MSSPSRPVYVPRQKRTKTKHHYQQQQPQRFHGAFTGGFSAGYYNTVGSAEGWKPSSYEDNEPENDVVGHEEAVSNPAVANKKRRQSQSQSQQQQQQQQQRSIEDYMDEQDHNEWGGPVKVKEEYNNNNAERSDLRRRKTPLSIQDEGLDSMLDQVIFHQQKQQREDGGDEPSYKVNIGKRLLRHLGWKGNNTVYARTDTKLDDTKIMVDDNNDDDEMEDSHNNMAEQIFLSKRNLRKITLQQVRIQVPVPKLDTTGLGYVAFANAPEFQAAKEQRMKIAQQRVSSLHGKDSKKYKKNKSVYRISDVLDGGLDDEDDDDNQDDSQTRHHEDTTTYQETLEDFVGTKSASGFALHDDDDNAYDDDNDSTTRPMHTSTTRSILSITADLGSVVATPEERTTEQKKFQVNQDTYETVAYEHSDSDPEEMNDDPSSRTKLSKKHRTADVFGILLSSWATGDTTTGTTGEEQQPTTKGSSSAVTSDGKSVLSGFVLGSTGGGGGGGTALQRFRGPDIPSGYEVTPHQFTANEHPSVLQGLSRTEREEVTKQRRQNVMQDALSRNAIIPIGSSKNSTASVTTAVQSQALQKGILQKSNAFVGIAASMKSRFAVSSSSHDSGAEPVSRPAGLSLPSYDGTKAVIFNGEQQPSASLETGSSVTVKRTVIPFVPAPLLCKRFHVVYQKTKYTISGDTRTREQAYFEDEILKRATDATRSKDQDEKQLQCNSSIVKPATAAATDELYKQQAKHILQQLLAELNDESKSCNNQQHEDRPSLSIYKSIFEPQRAESSSDDDDADDSFAENERDHVRIENSVNEGSVIPRGATDDIGLTDLVPNSESARSVPALSKQAADDVSSNRGSGNQPAHRIVPYDKGHQPGQQKQSGKDRSKTKQRHSRDKRSRSHGSDSSILSTSSSDLSINSQDDDLGSGGSAVKLDYPKDKHRESKKKKRRDDEKKKKKRKKKRKKHKKSYKEE